MSDNKSLEDYGFSDVMLLGKKRDKDIYTAEKGGKKYVLKVPHNPESEDKILTEVCANEFMRSKIPENIPLRIPESRILRTEDSVIGCSEFLEFDALGDQDKGIVSENAGYKHIEKMYRILKFFWSISRDDLPGYLKNKIAENDKGKCVRKMEINIQNVPQDIRNESEERFWENIHSIKFRRHFNHHDFALWNMSCESDGRIILLDSEFARWGIKWYDPAYFFIQTYTKLQNPQLAIKFLDYVLKNTPDDIQKEIMFPLHYRILVNFNECPTERSKILTRVLFRKILSISIDEVLKKEEY